MRSQRIATNIITVLLVLLWAYTGPTKLMDYPNFKSELSKSPLLSSFTGIAAVGVPLLEIGIASLFLNKKLQIVGLYASLFLLILFTAYIIAILSLPYEVPCACLGFIEGLSWRSHIVFNMSFALLAFTGIIIHQKQARLKTAPI